ncbi:glucose-6-phosphate dehydrogenase [Methylobacterium oryzisoli]|uniref:glucose-6-phosphate dehydrogenase n=1 Tax=Methylobacterium oryzisoli TaxID=3385502 RepID=UPI0038926127
MTASCKPTADSASGTAPAPACTLVIFGAGGDLTKRLLMPALYNLAGAGLLNEGTGILGLDRLDLDDAGWAQSLTETMESFTHAATAEFHVPKIDETAWGFVRERLHYLKADFGSPDTFAELGRRLSGNVVFYLAVAARFFGPVVTKLGEAGLLKEVPGAFRRVVIEKPFGADLPSAQALNSEILAAADESQLYRIDHFLGKDTVQSIEAIRFANRQFEPVWNRDHIACVEITAAETVGVEGRGGFYEPTGALRDMVPNHLFQLLCMVAMEPPAALDAEAVRSEKARLIQAVRPVAPGDAVRGQYTAGSVLGEAVRGYREEPNVAADSCTETYVALELAIENGRWSGVPFYLRTGKHLSARRTEIAVTFKPSPLSLFKDRATCPSIMRLMIDPEHGTDTTLAVKVPGPEMRLAQVHAQFRYRDAFPQKPNVGYETLLYDCLRGDATLFQRADAIESAWAAVQPLLDAWQAGEPEFYVSGSEGPAAADALLARKNHAWLPLDPSGTKEGGSDE